MIGEQASTLGSDQHLDEILADYLRAVEAGQPVARESLLARHPDLAGDLADFFADLDRVEEVAVPLRAIRQAVGDTSHLDAAIPRTEADTVNEPPPVVAKPDKSKIRCPTCHNPIHLTKESTEVLCPGCGGMFRLCDANCTDTTSGMRSMGKFQLMERLGLGSFGAVWKAHDTELKRIVALKIPHTGLLTENEELERFQREARAAAQLRHPNIVTVFEVARLNGMPVIVAEFVAGVPLKDLLEVRRLSFRQSAALILQLADALEYAHSLGVVHRDVKPANVMLLRGQTAHNPAGDAASQSKDELAEIGKPMVLDFGLALRDAGEMTLTVDGHILGTPAYMSPEQARGQSHQADRRSDVYSLGVMLYEMLTRELPFRGSRVMLLDQVLHEEPRPPRKLNDKIPRDLETICLKCLRKEPAKRYATAAELAADLRLYLAGEPIHARPVSSAEQLLRWVRRRPTGAALMFASTVAVLGLAGAIVGWYSNQKLAEHAKASDEAQAGARGMVTTRVERPFHDKVRENLDAYHYIHHVGLAQRAWQNNDLDRSREVLDGMAIFAARGWEWHYLNRLCHPADATQDGRTFRQPGGRVSSLAFSPDGRWLVTGGQDGTVVLHDLSGKKPPRSLCKVGAGNALPQPAVLSVAISGTRVAAGIGDQLKPQEEGHIAVWELRSSEKLFEHAVAGAARCVAFSPDGKYLAACAGDSFTGTVQIWHADGGRPLDNFSPGVTGVRCVAFNWDGTCLAGAVSNAHAVKIWAVSNGDELLELKHDERDRTLCLAYSPDGHKLYTGNTSKVVGVWDAHNGEPLEFEQLRGHSSEVRGLAFSPDGRRLVTASTDQTLRLWDLHVHEEMLTLAGHAAAVDAVAFSGDLIASASQDGTVRIWDGRPLGKK